jgi:hypothetical protein
MSTRKDAWEAFGIRIGPFGIDINSPGQAITRISLPVQTHRSGERRRP